MRRVNQLEPGSLKNSARSILWYLSYLSGPVPSFRGRASFPPNYGTPGNVLAFVTFIYNVG
jgi:hypothetical protein